MNVKVVLIKKANKRNCRLQTQQKNMNLCSLCSSESKFAYLEQNQ